MALPRISVLFETRAWPLRLAILAALAIGYLLARGPSAEPSIVDWLLSAASVLVYAGSARWPLASPLVQAVLLAVALWAGDASPVIVKVGAGVALFELAMRRSGWYCVYGTVPLLLVYLVEGSWSTLYRGAVVTLVPVLLGAYVRSVRLLSAQAERRAEEERLRRRSETRAARADERTAIARELHDLVAHHVASMVLRVGVARHVLDDADPKVREVLDDVHASGVATLADLRRLVTVLRDPAGGGQVGLVEPGELPAALSEVVDRAQRLGLSVSAQIDPGIAGLDTMRGLAILRLTQEGLANVARHAGPQARTTVSVRLIEAGMAQVDIADDGGRGHPELSSGTRGSLGHPELSSGRAAGSAVADATGGHGIIGMRERVAVLGGSLTVGRDGPGWRLSALLPAAGGSGGDKR
ncbi:hypothetical protein GCM10027280_02040 [Micromonospora polyrhachis]|uniref:histidine kinase n=1 Tax=Micromonospora polyrhachis TaxID=1282883 RepID=A0A7W7SMJ7_9ACTN|nr:histidine kinase [Micromonospora polyrhachis]MBB4957504.1 signal transduction histidine kinase [Micromonospora polyrhachis]